MQNVTRETLHTDRAFRTHSKRRHIQIHLSGRRLAGRETSVKKKSQAGDGGMYSVVNRGTRERARAAADLVVHHTEEWLREREKEREELQDLHAHA